MSVLDNLFIDLINATGDLAHNDTHHVEELKRIHRLLTEIQTLTLAGELPDWAIVYPAIKPEYRDAFTKINMIHVLQAAVTGLIQVAQTELTDHKDELLTDLLRNYRHDT
jgi:hypothetical protein